MKVLVTGATGFVGSAVMPKLIAAGHSLRCLARPSSNADRIAAYSWERCPGDVRDADSVSRAIEGCDAVVHMACLSAWDQIDSPLMDEVVEGGTRNILQAAAVRGAKVVYVSSVLAVNGSDEPRVFTEDDAWTLPVTNLRYANMKRRAEALCAEFVAKGLRVVIVNPGEVYGPGDTGFITAGNLVDFAKSNPVLVCHGGGAVVHLDDCAAGIVAALEKGTPGRRYILAGENLTVSALAALTLELLGQKKRIVKLPNGLIRTVAATALKLRIPMPFNPRVIPYATQFWFADSSRAQRELAVQFRSARETLAPTLDWLTKDRYIS
jgi:dihydroflavonol-4-reductase